jgi:hypothetical protein
LLTSLVVDENMLGFVVSCVFLRSCKTLKKAQEVSKDKPWLQASAGAEPDDVPARRMNKKTRPSMSAGLKGQLTAKDGASSSASAGSKKKEASASSAASSKKAEGKRKSEPTPASASRKLMKQASGPNVDHDDMMWELSQFLEQDGRNLKQEQPHQEQEEDVVPKRSKTQHAERPDLEDTLIEDEQEGGEEEDETQEQGETQEGIRPEEEDEDQEDQEEQEEMEEADEDQAAQAEEDAELVEAVQQKMRLKADVKQEVNEEEQDDGLPLEEEDGEEETPEDDVLCDEVPPPVPAKETNEKVNSSTHKKEYMALDRKMKNQEGAYPSMRKLWFGSMKERNDLLRNYVESGGEADKVEGKLTLKATRGTRGNTRRALLTVRQMKQPPHCFPKEKIRNIVANKPYVADEDAPNLKSARKYWCMVSVVRDDYDQNESVP